MARPHDISSGASITVPLDPKKSGTTHSEMWGAMRVGLFARPQKQSEARQNWKEMAETEGSEPPSEAVQACPSVSP